MILRPYKGMHVHIKFGKTQYYELITEMNDPKFSGDYVESKKMRLWLYTVVLGNIVPEQLESKRQRENNTNDMW